MPLRTDFLNTKEVMKRLGISRRYVVRLVSDGRLAPAFPGSKPNLFKPEDVERIRREELPEGLIYREVAAVLGVAINTAKKYIMHAKIAPVGFNRLRGSYVFSPAQVKQLALSLGVPENLIDESLAQYRAGEATCAPCESHQDAR